MASGVDSVNQYRQVIVIIMKMAAASSNGMKTINGDNEISGEGEKNLCGNRMK